MNLFSSRKLILIISITLLELLFVGCGKNNNGIIGQWGNEDGYFIEFFDDGTYYSTFKMFGHGTTGTYNISERTLGLSDDLYGAAFLDYTLEKNILNLSNEDPWSGAWYRMDFSSKEPKSHIDPETVIQQQAYLDTEKLISCEEVDFYKDSDGLWKSVFEIQSAEEYKDETAYSTRIIGYYFNNSADLWFPDREIREHETEYK